MTNIDVSKENRLIKHSAAVHISNEITVIDRKIYNVLLRNAFNQRKESVYTISIMDIIKDLGHESYKNYEFIEAAVQKLSETFITFNILKKDKKKKWLGTIAMLSQAVAEGGGSIRYSFPPLLESSFFSPNIYASLNLEYQKNLHSKHSLAIWEFCTEQLDSAKSEKITTRAIDLKTLRSLLGAHDSYYDEFKFLNSKVIKPAVREVNEVADINIEVQMVKDRRTVVAIIFVIERKAKNINSSSSQNNIFHQDGSANIIKLLNDTIEEQDLTHLAGELAISEEFLAKLKNKYNHREIRSCMDAIRKKIKENKIKNVAAYLTTMLDQGIFENDANLSVRTEGSNTLNAENMSAILVKEQAFINRGEHLKPVLNELRSKFGDGIYISWILRLNFIDDSNQNLTLAAPSQFIKDWIENKYIEEMLECFITCGFKYKKIIIEIMSDK